MNFQAIKPQSGSSDPKQDKGASKPFTIASINQLDLEDKRSIYLRVIPGELIEHLQLGADLKDNDGNDLLSLNCPKGSTTTEMSLYHQVGFPDPVLYGQITDTINGQIHVLLYILNDPESPRFDIDRTPDGQETKFGTQHRNLDAEIAAMEFGLAPGQIRRGLRMLGEAIQTFEQFVSSLGNELYFAEPLHYHNAILFERYGFAYEKGRRLMERIQVGFEPGGELQKRLDGSNPFRRSEAADSIRLRSWALYDNIMGEPYSDVTMYKWIGKSAGLNTCEACDW